jgi:hypothetical protein
MNPGQGLRRRIVLRGVLRRRIHRCIIRMLAAARFQILAARRLVSSDRGAQRQVRYSMKRVYGRPRASGVGWSIRSRRWFGTMMGREEPVWEMWWIALWAPPVLEVPLWLPTPAQTHTRTQRWLHSRLCAAAHTRGTTQLRLSPRLSCSTTTPSLLLVPPSVLTHHHSGAYHPEQLGQRTCSPLHGTLISLMPVSLLTPI